MADKAGNVPLNPLGYFPPHKAGGCARISNEVRTTTDPVDGRGGISLNTKCGFKKPHIPLRNADTPSVVGTTLCIRETSQTTPSHRQSVRLRNTCVGDPPVTEPIRQGTVTTKHVDTGLVEASNRSSLTNRRDVQQTPIQKQTKKRTPYVKAQKQTHSGVRKKVPQQMLLQWRIGAAPAVALAISREEKQILRVLSQATAFYNSMFEVYWSPQTQANPYVYDLDNRVEVLRDSSVTAACLVAANKTHLAQEVIGRVLSTVDDLLRDPPPGLYLILAESALGLVKTPNDLFRDQVVGYVASRALEILGAEHPLTTMLTLKMPQLQKEELGDRLWKNLIPMLERFFGSDHYQSSTQNYCRARNMASCGRVDEAIKLLERQVFRWSELYGGNSLIVCYSKIELANILVGAGSYLKAEFVVSDALRTSDMIQAAELRNEECQASEKRHRKSSIAFPKVAALRTLGKLHTLRGNLGAALYYYSQAVAVGTSSLGKTSAVIELAQADLESTRTLELKRNQENLSSSEIANLTNIVPSPTS